ncbi:MAG: S8 family serine peptidase [Bdellovibrio sp.]
MNRGLAISLLSLSLILSACNRNGNDNISNAEFSSGQTASNLSPKIKFDFDKFAVDNTQFVKRNALTKSTSILQMRKEEARQIVVPVDSKLVVEVDNKCLQQQQSQLALIQNLSAQAFDKKSLNNDLQHQVLPLAIQKDTTMGELSEMADQDECVLSIANDIHIKPSFVPNDPFYSYQKAMVTMRASDSFDTFFSGSTKINNVIKIAVLDTGVDATHPDLAANLWKDTNGDIGYDFYNGDSVPEDDDGHGTFVAGLIGAQLNNGTGIAGVMGSNVKIMAVKVLGSDGGSSANIANGIRYAISKKADVINMSLGGVGRSTIIEDAMKEALAAGITIVVAAGNDGQLLTDTNWQTPVSYARDLPGLISVGAIDSETKERSSFSNYSVDFVKMSAPGSNGIVSTFPNNQYASGSGTSFSSPMAAGAAGLIIGYLRTMNVASNPALVEKLLLSGSANLSSLSTYFKNGGTVDLAKLASTLKTSYPSPVNTSTQPTPTPSPTPTPTPTTSDTTSTNCDKMSTRECEVVRLVNVERKNRGLKTLTILSKCVAEAQFHSTDMAENNYFSHNSPTETVSERFTRYGLSSSAWGENIAYGYATPADVMKAWMNSTGHRANILRTTFKSMGVGAVTASNGRIYWTQCFSGLIGETVPTL